jgi:hypothetical protein
MTTTDQRRAWRSPAGRIHNMRHCSGNGQPARTQRVTITREEFDALVAGRKVCRCALRLFAAAPPTMANADPYARHTITSIGTAHGWAITSEGPRAVNLTRGRQSVTVEFGYDGGLTQVVTPQRGAPWPGPGLLTRVIGYLETRTASHPLDQQ